MVCDCIICKNMLSKLTSMISYMLCLDLLLHNYYLEILTGKHTVQFFIDKSVSLTAINMYLLVRKVLYNGRKGRGPRVGEDVAQ